MSLRERLDPALVVDAVSQYGPKSLSGTAAAVSSARAQLRTQLDKARACHMAPPPPSEPRPCLPSPLHTWLQRWRWPAGGTGSSAAGGGGGRCGAPLPRQAESSP